MAHKPSEVASPTGPIDYKELNVPTRLLLVWTIGLFVSLGLICAGVWFLYGTPNSHPQGELVRTRAMNQPALQVDAVAEMKVLRQEQDNLLNSYGWLNKEQGIVRLPIRRAMDLVIERGLPARAGGTP